MAGTAWRPIKRQLVESGSAKSTVLNCLIGDERASAGSMRLASVDDGSTDLFTLPAAERRKLRVDTVSIVYQDPARGLDPANRELALGLVSSLTAQGVAVLAVFHDLDAIRQLATRDMECGQVVASGDGQRDSR